jgi:hypothetical protein
LSYLQDLRHNRPNPGLLETRLAAVFPSPETALDKHLAHLETQR